MEALGVISGGVKLAGDKRETKDFFSLKNPGA
jgi:hypothetical protein